MKIIPDAKEINPGRVSDSNSTVNRARPEETATIKNSTDSQFIQSMTRRLRRDRSLENALSIAQMSQQLIQKVMTITQQLKQIAIQAMTTGRVNTDELNRVVADIRMSLGNYGADVVNPVADAAAGTARIETPDLSDEIFSLNNIADGLGQGNLNVMDRVDKLMNAAQVKSDTFNTAFDRFISSTREFGISYSPLESSEIGTMVSQSRDLILESPEIGLFAQGNINSDQAGRLIMP